MRNPALRWPVDIPAVLRGARILDVTRRAKYLLLKTQRGTLMIHLGMSGSLRIVEPEEPPTQSAAAASGPQTELELTFTGNCWTEVTDTNGERLFFDLGTEGQSVQVSGSAPLRVLLGSYANVSLAVNGRDYPIPASARRGETARFTIDSL